jgi:serpin B
VNSLGLEFLRRAPADENSVFSPYSLQSTLGMIYGGASGATRDEMARALGYPDDETMLHASLALLRLAIENTKPASVIASTGPRAQARSQPLSLAIANRLFVQMGIPYRWPYQVLLQERYGAPFILTDFAADKDAAASRINGWVAKQTQQHIRDLVLAGGLSSGTRLVAVNAVYMNAPWKQPFSRARTKAKPFSLKRSAPVDVPTMSGLLDLGYARHKDWSIVTIPYVGDQIQLVIMLPDKELDPSRLAKRLRSQDLKDVANLSTVPVKLHLPKFKTSPEALDVSHILSLMGMKLAFQDDANFSRMTEVAMRVSRIVHRALVSVDESGTEAAAATAIGMVEAIGLQWPPPPPPIEVHVDRPFLFAIQHRPSGACLFMGRVADPR